MVAVDAQPQSGIRYVDRPVPGRYIVVLQQGEDPLAVGTETARLTGGRLRHVYRNAITGFAVDLPEQAAQALVNDFRVLYVEEDGFVNAASVQQGSPWGLDRIDQRSLPLDAKYEYGRDGSGVNVYVVDSGIRVDHTEFGGRAFIAGDHVDDAGNGDPTAIANDDANAAVPDGDDCFGHGTHVAGLVGGTTYGVAKNVTLWAHRVLDCSGSGSTAAVVAAVDAITADTTRRPALAVIGLSAPASTALDAAIRQSIVTGVTYVVAAGNRTIDASTTSPARVFEAMTVAATTPDDARASFSNFGPVVDLFAPGVSIDSAAIASITATSTASGTSMAASHVAGAAALYLERRPQATPFDVHHALIAASTAGVVTQAGAGSPSRLLYSPPTASWVASESRPLGTLASAGPSVTVTSPNAPVNWAVGSRQRITWKHNLGEDAYVRIDVSRDGGVTYSTVAAAVSSGQATTGAYEWAVTGPYTASAMIRVSWTGGLAADASDAAFTIAAPYITLSAPAATTNWGYGSRQRQQWQTNLGPGDRIDVTLSVNGGQTYANTLASGVTASDQSVDFAVPSLSQPTTRARVRARWSNRPSGSAALSALNPADFRIEPAFVRLTGPNGGETWMSGTTATLQWLDNIGPLEFVRLHLSLDGGASYSTVLARKTPSTGIAHVTVSNTWITASARVRVRWLQGTRPSDVSDGTFRVAAMTNAPPSVALTAPANGATYSAPATMTVSADASDTDGTVARVDFYQGTTLIGSDTTSPYSVMWGNVAAGSYSLTAVASDDDGATSASAARTVTVTAAPDQRTVVFAPSNDHDALVNYYRLEIFAQGANPAIDAPIATQNLGKPAVVAGECSADVTATIDGLAPGNYQATVAAVGDGGVGRGVPIAFTR